MNNKHYLYALSLPCLGLFLVSCLGDGEDFENKLFIEGESLVREVRVAVDEGVDELDRTFTLSLARPLAQELKISFRRDDSLLETYRQANADPTAELLPESCCDLSSLGASIPAGAVSSSEVKVSFRGLSGLDYGNSHVLPLSVEASDVPVLERSGTVWFVVREASLVNVVADLTSNKAWPDWGAWEKVKDLRKFTMEALINCRAFNNESSIMTVMGIEDHFLIRIGDVTIPKNQIQVALAYRDEVGNSINRADVTSAALQLKADRWYHLAVTFDKGYVKVYLDGKLRAEADKSVIGSRIDGDTEQSVPIPFTGVDFSAAHSDEMDGKPRCFWVGYSYDDGRDFDGMMAEVRLWGKVLSEEEINAPNHFYKLYPGQIDGSLLAYWKFDDGAGATVKDHSTYAKDLSADHALGWYGVNLPKCLQFNPQ